MNEEMCKRVTMQSTEKTLSMTREKKIHHHHRQRQQQPTKQQQKAIWIL